MKTIEVTKERKNQLHIKLINGQLTQSFLYGGRDFKNETCLFLFYCALGEHTKEWRNLSKGLK